MSKSNLFPDRNFHRSTFVRPGNLPCAIQRKVAIVLSTFCALAAFFSRNKYTTSDESKIQRKAQDEIPSRATGTTEPLSTVLLLSPSNPSFHKRYTSLFMKMAAWFEIVLVRQAGWFHHLVSNGDHRVGRFPNVDRVVLTDQFVF